MQPSGLYFFKKGTDDEKSLKRICCEKKKNIHSSDLDLWEQQQIYCAWSSKTLLYKTSVDLWMLISE